MTCWPTRPVAVLAVARAGRQPVRVRLPSSTASPPPCSRDDAAAGAAAANPVAVSPAAGHPGRLAEHADQLPRRGRARRCRDVRVVGLAQRRALRACCAPTRPAPARASCPRHPSLAGERVTVSAQRERSAARRSAAQHQLHDRPPGGRQPERVPDQPRRPTRGPALQLGTLADALDGAASRRRRRPRRAPGDLFLAPYQGDGSPGPMITDQSGGLVWFHPLPAGRRRDQLPGAAATKASRC